MGRASVPRVIAGTRICKLVTRSLVVDGHRAEVNPNSRVQRSIVSEEAHAPRCSVWSNSKWERASFAAQTQSFLCGKFFTARLEVLPNLRHGGVFQMSTMVNFGIGLTRRWAFSLRLHKITGDTLCTNSGLLESGLKVRKYHVMLFLRTCMSQKWMWFWPLLISFKVTAEIEIRKHMFCIVLRRRGVSAL